MAKEVCASNPEVLIFSYLCQLKKRHEAQNASLRPKPDIHETLTGRLSPGNVHYTEPILPAKHRNVKHI